MYNKAPTRFTSPQADDLANLFETCLTLHSKIFPLSCDVTCSPHLISRVSSRHPKPQTPTRIYERTGLDAACPAFDVVPLRSPRAGRTWDPVRVGEWRVP